MAECHDMAVAPHCPLGPIALASCIQLDFCTPNAFIQEQSLDIHKNNNSEISDYLQEGTNFHYKDGYIERSQLPGLGILVDEEKVERGVAKGHDWHNPVWHLSDGTPIEW